MRCYACGGTYARTIMRAFAKGRGELVEPANPKYQSDVTVVWGLARGAPEIIEKAEKAGDPWFYVDHGYVKRGHTHGYYRVTYRGFQKTWVEDRPEDRWEALGTPLRPWKTGSDVVIVPPSATVRALFGPVTLPQGVESKKDGKPVPEKFPNARVVVTWNSVAAVEAAIAGIPCVVYGESAAKPIASPSIDDIRTPDRQAWANSLAYAQFTLKEMEAGTAWNVLCAYLSDTTAERSCRGTSYATLSFPGVAFRSV